MKPQTSIITTLLAIGMTTASSNAAFTLIENFESLTTGQSIQQAGSAWVRNSNNTSSVVVDPADMGNKVGSLSSETGQVSAYLPLGANSIANTSTGTIFFRARAATVSPNMNLGGSDVMNPANLAGQYGDFENQLRFDTDLDARPNSGFATIGSVSANVWVNFWLVIDNVNNTTSYYSSTGSNAAALLGDPTYSFRNGTAQNAITTFLTIAESGTGRAFYVDDIYVDNTSANTLNPVPEPSAALLGALGMSALLSCRKRNKPVKL